MCKLELLRQKALEFKIELDEGQVEKFRRYLGLLQEYNRHTNLVSSAETETLISKHFLDSLAMGLLSGEIDFNRELNLIDIGIGGGFPGIPLLIAYPHWKLCAVDSVSKKLKFIEILCKKLGISDRIEIVSARAEGLAHMPGKREAFDLAVTRAVARMNVICEYCLPFVRPGGYFVAYKAKTASEELEDARSAIHILGGNYIKTVQYTLSGKEERNLVLIKKISPTPQKYPRKPGMPAKKPLI
jgi:16S rRNA (guanine527-N7)-methyltransferase